MGEYELIKKNGFILTDALFGLFVMILCAGVLFSVFKIVEDDLVIMWIKKSIPNGFTMIEALIALFISLIVSFVR